MPQHVVVLMQAELSDTDAERVAALHADSGGLVSYHLLVGDGDCSEGAAALFGVDRADMFGSMAVARKAGRQDPDEDEPPPGARVLAERSAQRLRGAAAEQIDFALTHTDIWSSARALVRSTGSRELIVVADTDSFPQVSLPEWQRRARDYLAVDRLHAIEHTP